MNQEAGLHNYKKQIYDLHLGRVKSKSFIFF
jgi:hypothetical protein